ncbi:hypothetical protein PTTG_07279 [Puccinia triticina 1-1 BBBD Race 1]|uniref:Uncharacterized protein n=1 Tax=Puccinia triticina (isolate 1-1 / race 1 (BBBD)) TaxID=630390 RepID=A0A180GHC7_PUCT1|nr:hypothetical protein PTTG_07279 [Puccinia triticina 1-1 BBBD Race 1]WAR62499.1 hypothetical protein PtB15_15B84 [Puccinia triticina]
MHRNSMHRKCWIESRETMTSCTPAKHGRWSENERFPGAWMAIASVDNGLCPLLVLPAPPRCRRGADLSLLAFAALSLFVWPHFLLDDETVVGAKDAQPEAEQDHAPVVFGKGCVLHDDHDEFSQHIIKTILQSERELGDGVKEEDEKDAKDAAKKPCLIRMFKGDELDENFVYTDSDMVSIISRIVDENVDCFEIEEVQTATYDRLKFFNEESTVDAASGWEEIVHKTPIQELFSMIEFLREHARDSSEADERPMESPFVDVKTVVPEEPSQVTEAEEKAVDEPEEESSGSIVVVPDPDLLPSDHAPMTATLAEKKTDDAGTCAEEKGPDTIAPMEDQAKTLSVQGSANLLARILHETFGGDGAQKAPVAARPKVAPLDLSSIASKEAAKGARPASGLPLLRSRLDSALLSPLRTAKLRDAVRPLEELYLRSAKDFDKLDTLWAACGLIRACDTPRGPEGGFGDGTPAVC